MRKKWIAAALVCTMGVTSLAGCGNSANSNASTEADAQDTQSDDGVVTLKVWSEESNFDFMNQMIESFKQEYAAYSLGAAPLTVFRKVIFPLSLPGIISGCVLVFTMSMTSYVTPKLLGGSKFRMMATMVVQEINVNFDWQAASAISYILLGVILLVQVLVVLITSGYMKRLGGGKNA